MIDSCYLGDVRDGLRAIQAAGIRPRMCVTSPPYWGLRDYGVDGQIGLEPTPGEFVERMVEVFRIVRDALTDDGTLWLNLGDSYAQNGRPGWQGQSGARSNRRFTATRDHVAMRDASRHAPAGLKPKDLVGMPWRVAFALQDDGWYLRQDIIWAKPNPMPESVRDRCTKAHEYLFLLSKRGRYYFDQHAIAEPRASEGDSWVSGWATGDQSHDAVSHDAVSHARDKGDARSFRGGGKYTSGQEKTPDPVRRETHGNQPALAAKRNRRSVWTLPSEPFPEAHFATFPRALVELCVLSGSAVGDTVLDPFLGSGTTAQVAQALGRSWVGCELNPDYHAMIARRTAQRGMVLPLARIKAHPA